MKLTHVIFFIGIGVVAHRLHYLAKSMQSSSRYKIIRILWTIISTVLFVLSLPYMLTFYILEQSECQDKQGSSYNEGWRDGFNAAKEKSEINNYLK